MLQESSKKLLQLQLQSQKPTGQLLLQHQQPRRGSFLYRNETYETPLSAQAVPSVSRSNLSQFNSCHSSVSASPTSTYEHLCADDHLVTPFALILQRLQLARDQYVEVNQLNDQRRRRSSSIHYDRDPNREPITNREMNINREININREMNINKEINTNRETNRKSTNALLSPDQSKLHDDCVLDILDHMDWCLDQLEAIQTHRSLGDLTSSKFKRILKRELEHLSESGKSGNQISQYISKTFLDKEDPAKDGELDKISHLSRPSRDSIGALSPPQHESPTATPTNHSLNLKSPLSVRGRTSPCSSMANIPLFRHPAGDVNLPQNQFGKEKSFVKDFPGEMESMSHEKRKITNRSKGKEDDGNDVDFVSEECPFGVKEADNSGIEKHTGKLDDWNMDIFSLHDLSNGHPLVVVAYSIFKQRGMLQRFQIDGRTLLNYLATVESHYRLKHFYHNRMHAADVTNCVHVLLNKQPLLKVFSDVEILSAIFAAIIHDVDHPGLTNQHLINTNSDLALMYNDESILENHHLAVAFKLLQSPACDIFQNFTESSRKRIRKNVISMVLATDMSKHMTLLAGLKTMVEARKVSGTGVLLFDEGNDRLQVLKCLLHCADLSNPTKQLPIYKGWIARVMNEFHQQGDVERSLGLEISPMCDRNNTSIEKSQVSFIDFVVQPLWEAWAELVEPHCNDILLAIDSNKNHYQLLDLTSSEDNESKGLQRDLKKRQVVCEKEMRDVKKEEEMNVFPVKITIERSISVFENDE